MEAELGKLRKEVEDAKHREEVAERRAEEAQREVRNTTLVEYLKYCHQHLFTTFEVQRDPRITTVGPASAPHGKLCPTYLRHWDDFDTLQRCTLDSLFTLYPANQRSLPEPARHPNTGPGDVAGVRSEITWRSTTLWATSLRRPYDPSSPG